MIFPLALIDEFLDAAQSGRQEVLCPDGTAASLRRRLYRRAKARGLSHIQIELKGARLVLTPIQLPKLVERTFP